MSSMAYLNCTKNLNKRQIDGQSNGLTKTKNSNKYNALNDAFTGWEEIYIYIYIFEYMFNFNSVCGGVLQYLYKCKIVTLGNCLRFIWSIWLPWLTFYLAFIKYSPRLWRKYGHKQIILISVYVTGDKYHSKDLIKLKLSIFNGSNVNSLLK